MSVLPIRVYGDPVLKEVTVEVDNIDGRIASLAETMIETMYEAPGVGLAANQIGVQKRLFVYDKGDGPVVVVNPVIVESDGEWTYEEGCLSVPRVYADVIRPSKIKVKYLDYFGENKELEVGNNLLSVCIQHEIDHTNGIVFIDHLSKMKREFILKKMIKINDM